MAKLKIESNGDTVAESESFIALVLVKEDDVVYTRSYSSTKHLSYEHHLVLVASLLDVVAGAMKELVENSGVQLLFESQEFKGDVNGGDGHSKEDNLHTDP